MGLENQVSLADSVLRVTITIPGSSDDAVLLLDLIVAALNEREDKLGDKVALRIVGGKIHKAKAAYLAGDTPTDLPIEVAVDEVYDEPASAFIKSTYVKAYAVTSIAQPVSVYLWWGRA